MSQKLNIKTWLRFWFPLLAYSGIIFILSSLKGSDIQMSFSVWDKLEHAVEYAVLGFLAARAFNFSWRFTPKLLWFTAVVFCVMYGISDEFHQSFVPGRDASLGDVVADSIGGMLGATIYLILNKKEHADVSS